MKQYIRRIKYFAEKKWGSLRTLAYWFPVIWQDRDWDWWYLVVIMRHKLASMEREMGGDVVATRQIRLCKLLCDRIMDESRYIDIAQARQDFFRRRPDIVDQCQHVDYLKAQDIALLTKAIRKYLYSWWN